MQKSTTLFFIVMLFVFAGKAQNNSDAAAKESKRLLELSQKLEGTYQVQIIDSRELGEIPLQYMDSVIAKRSRTETVYFYYPNKRNIRLMILPQVVIDNPNYTRPEKFVHISL